MPRSLEENVAHLLRRAGFGASPEEMEFYVSLGYEGAVDYLVNYERVPDLVDGFIGRPDTIPLLPEAQLAGYVPNYNLTHARLRWLFRMLYTRRPLQEKMALFWHHHFATGYTKIAGERGGIEATRLMAAKPSEDPAEQLGQIELFRNNPLANFKDLLLAVTEDAAMLHWLDGRRNFAKVPQENYGREVMELFTGVPHTEDDVKAAARVFTGWNLQTTLATRITLNNRENPLYKYTYFYNSRQHDTNAKTFSFPIYADGGKTIPARAATQGRQDGLDFLAALVAHPATATHLARRLWRFFGNDIGDPSPTVIAWLAELLRSSDFDMRAVMRALFLSDHFLDDANFFARFEWPVERLIRQFKAIGPGSAPLSNYLGYVAQMGHSLFDPPSVEGYKWGATLINSTTMLARANLASYLAQNRRAAAAEEMVAQGIQGDRGRIIDFWLWRLGITNLEPEVRVHLNRYMATGVGATWTGSTSQLQAKVTGLFHLLSGLGEYAFV